MSGVAPLKPWQRRQGSVTITETETLPPREIASSSTTPATGSACGATDVLPSRSPSPETAIAPTLAPSYNPVRVGAGYGYGGMMGSCGGYGSSMYGGSMNRYGSRQDSEFFGPTVDSLSRFNEILDFNSYLLDQIHDRSVNLYDRLKYILTWLFELKDVIRKSSAAFGEEKRELRRQIMKRMVAIGSLAALFLLWCVRTLQRRRKRQMLNDWARIFPTNKASL